MMMTKAFIFLNGEFPESKEFYENLNIDNAHLFCADGGARKALELNYIPKEVWGDFDSLDKNSIKLLTFNNVVIKSFNKNKDFTDGELLISYVSSLNYDKIYIIGGFGGRVDHFLTNINLIFKYNNLIFLNDIEKLFLVTSNFTIKNSKGKRISFIPFSDTIENLSLDGFLYPLKNHVLKRGDSTCLSNILTSNNASISFNDGKLLGVLSLD
ncbi:thiamine diphosphokinase [Cetobacterium somerae]|uniref:thiamine diphosphokinase n=1 Tax=Cetobacterium sp. NK01 TaxID=2993530 RepID=UPI00211679F6|nr:thiamine diphosphokinase [Cetobacterium sp. NK01]MCQ8211492.1 thiamine diphosphokinase [Cetobacterium sp. NK01]